MAAQTRSANAQKPDAVKTWKSELLAISRAGHDKNEIYVVLEEDGVFCLLADGKRRLLENPKKKKAIHLQKIEHLPESLLVSMDDIKTDADVRSILKNYRKSVELRKEKKADSTQV